MQSNRLAVIDLGTNSFQIIVAELKPKGKFEIIDRKREVVRIGKGSEKSNTKNLSRHSIDRGIKVLNYFKKLADSYGAKVVAIATSAVREAKNKKQFLDKVERKVGIKVKVISGIEEARLIHLGAKYGLSLKNKTVLLIDIGGGSTEIILSKNNEVILIKSLKLGAVRLTEKFFSDRKSYSEQVKACLTYVRKSIANRLREFKENRIVQVIGTSGTVQSLANTIRIQKDPKAEKDFFLHNYNFDNKAFHRLAENILSSDNLKSISKIEGIDIGRIDILPAGCIILKELFDYFKIKKMKVSSFALREGIIFKFIVDNKIN